MTTPLLCESPERRHPQEKCAPKCVHGTALCLHLFLTFSCGVAKLVRHRIVNPASEGSNPSATASLDDLELE